MIDREKFRGITVRACCADCTPEICVISTVNICKHPMTTSDSGCGPITMANREAAKKLIKIQQIEGADHAERKPSPARIRRDVEDGGGAPKAARPRKKANARKRRKRVSVGRQGPENRETGEARPQEIGDEAA